MNPTIFRATCRERLSHPVRVGSLIGTFLLPLLITVVDPQPQIADPFWAIPFAALLATGILGLEISSGALLLVFTRPIGRGSYVVSRWAAVAGAAAGLSLAQLGCQAGIVRAMGGEVPLELVLFGGADRAFLAIGVTSVFVLFSSIGSTVADLFFWVGANILAGALEASGRIAVIPSLAAAGRLLEIFANPRFDLYLALFSSAPIWAGALRYAATVLFCLAISIMVMNRRELSYATE